MLRRIQKSRAVKVLAIYLAINLLFSPNMLFALTGGPSQPEVQSFAPIGTSEMVDPFTGDFNYNIPLMDVGGYPINLIYNSGITMDQEASWVGLGWNLNPGVINRNMRGIPDDFKGERITKKLNMNTNETYTVSGTLTSEVFGVDPGDVGLSLEYGIGISYNNYVGVGLERIMNMQTTIAKSGKGKLTGNLGISSGTDGLSLSPSLSYESNIQGKSTRDLTLNSSIGASFNSRSGLSALTIGASTKESTAMEGSKSNLSTSSGVSSTINFGTQTYVPSISMPMSNFSASFSAKVGGTFFGVDPAVGMSGGYSQQRLAVKQQSISSFGYIYSQYGQHADRVILDFNREKDVPFSKNTPALPMTNHTYDLYSVSGQGVGGMFRPFRSDVGNVFDSRSTTTSGSFSLGVEVGVGQTAHSGADFNVTDVYSTSGKWSQSNFASPFLNFNANIDEPFYFKQVGEKSVDEDPMFNNYGGADAVRLELADVGGMEVMAINKIKRGYSGASTALPANYRTTGRAKRNQLMSFLTKSQVDAGYGLQNLSSNIGEDHHLAEISILKEDGSRYVYGLPLYNTKQVEATFNVAGRSSNCSNGLVTYGTGDDGTENHRGLDNYFSSTEMGPYAHSYLLTAVLSADYVDLTGNGPTDDDLGDYKLFTYETANNYKWRVPVGANQANFNEGLKSLGEDNKGSYIYGEKEIRYLSKIETKNYIAVFDTENNREDAKGVTSIDGTKEVDNNPNYYNNKMQLLKKISLYTKPDYNANGTNATALKEVHFDYDYSLCPGVPNNSNGGGKLTLKEVYFTYGKSKKGKLSPYKFSYNTHNPAYNLKGYDRWGNYKPNNGGCGALDPITTAEFPYVEQDDPMTDVYASAWSLSDIELPSGGDIHVNYESDDYAYVQNKRAMQMFKIVAASPTTAIPSTLSTPNAQRLMENNNTVNNYLFFELSSPGNMGDIASIGGKLYFRFLVDMTNSGNYEYVSGYTKILNSGVASNNPNYGYIQVAPNSGDHPISKAAWQFGRLNTPRLVWDQPTLSMGGIEHVLTALLGSLGNVKEMFQGANGTLRGKQYGKRFVANKSWVRLNNPDKKKKGGGVRVSKIEIADNWGSMTTGSTGNFNYGQEYFYDTNGDGTGTSTGVAAYEPELGGDENPWRQPVAFSDEHLLAPDDEHYMETPFGESFFPAPTVGYRKVTVRNLARGIDSDNNGVIDESEVTVKRNATGKVVHEFYTAYDFPTKVRQTDLDKRPKKTNPIIALFTFKDKDYMTASQGFAVELNDMHGKPKAQWVYAEGKPEAISGIEYKYASSGNTLVNDVKTINKNGSITTNMVGVEHELVADTREQRTSITNVGTNGNVAGFLAVFFPAVIPTVLPSYNNEETRFRSASMTKVIRRYGILEETIAHDLGSQVSTKNLAYDTETGEVLATETINNFDDPVYSLKYPAHWAYDKMGQAYKNIGKSRTVNLDNPIANPENTFVEGDEVTVGSVKGWVTELTPGSSGSMRVEDRYGNPFSGSKTLKVIRSGRRNMQSVSIGTLATKTNPLTNFSVNVFEDVLNADVIEFSEDWRTFCECLPPEGEFTSNPYVIGTKGNWRPKKSLLFLTDRLQTRENDNTNTRKDGTYKAFNPFWKLNNNNTEWMKDEANWTYTTEITEYSPQGFELENKDALGRYSAATYGYNNSLPTAVASNAQYKETAFDGFEDYDFGDCVDNHFSYKENEDKVVEEESHSGRRSIKVEPGQSVEVTKYLDECKTPLP